MSGSETRGATNETLRFLSKASTLLSSSLDYRETLASVARLAVPRLADWCVVDVVEEDGSLQRLAAEHEDPEKVALARRLQERYPPDPDAPYGVNHVVSTGRSELVPEIPESGLDEVARDEEHRDLLRTLGLKSYMVVPLLARGRMLGAISFVAAESGRRYGKEDLELAEDLARRAALAVDNARLYEEAQNEIAERRRTEEALREAEARKTAIMDAALDCIITMDEAGLVTDFNPAAEITFGHRRDEVLGRELAEVIIPPAFRDAHRRGLAHYLATGDGPVLNRRVELRGMRSDGSEFPVELTIVPIQVAGRPAFTGYLRDITERERAQARLQRAERLYRTLVDQMPAVTYIEALDAGERETNLVYASPQIEDLFGYSAEEWISAPDLFVRLLHPEDRERVLAADDLTERTGEPFREEYRQFTRDGRVLWIRDEAILVRDEEGNPLYWQGIIMDISEQKRVEEALRTQNEYLASLHETTLGLVERLDPTHLLRGILERAAALVGTTHGYIYLEDEGILQMSLGAGLFKDYVGKQIEPGDGLAGKVFVSAEPLSVDDYRTWENRVELFPDTIRALAGVPLWSGSRVTGVLALSYDDPDRRFGEQEMGVLVRFADLASVALDNAWLHDSARREIAARERTERDLAALVDELRRSNAELEQFAYVASHDLQEPLRMVSSYTQLLARRYQGRLDEDADEFIGFAVDGANRMQTLINDLLQYSRVGTRGRDLAPTETGAILDAACANLRVLLEESDAKVTSDELPIVMGDPVQLSQLFQNLIGNAVKFSKEGEQPRIHVGAERRDGDWLFSVRDNGIGIEPEYRERIFVIFQRLHARTEYSGTGIGLAVCKKIVERHGGKIWVDSVPGEGSTFYFTLRAGE
ncbi:MAG TPA: PAS domain S-box protein [Rubrobacter sp.]|nr:PAS domain S-box protein [Rubrobacter sp.]